MSSRRGFVRGGHGSVPCPPLHCCRTDKPAASTLLDGQKPPETIQNPYWHDFIHLANNGEGGRLRKEMVCRYALAVTSPLALKAIARFAPQAGIIELGAGTGYWQYCLHQMGIDMVAYDNCPVESGDNRYFTLPTSPWSQVRFGEPPVVAEHSQRALMLCWPPSHLPMASEALRFYRGDHLIYIGYRKDRHTGDPAFHRRLKRHWKLVKGMEIPRWASHEDLLFLYRRK